MSFHNTRVRLLLGGAALAAFVLTSSACSDEKSNVAADQAVAVTSTAAATAPSTVPPTTIVTAIDPTALLQQAMAGLASGYHFQSLVLVNGAQTLLADGDRIGADSRLNLASNGVVVSYIVTASGSYALPEGGEWELLDVPPASADPIAALASPTAVGVVSDDGTSVRLRVTVPALSLGVGATGTADVEVVITNGALAQVDYSAPIDGGVAVVATAIGPVVDATPIVAPI
jgi:hypothetical protein